MPGWRPTTPTDPFDIDDVAGGIVDKPIRRHPHVFGDADAPDAETVEANWESIKTPEKGPIRRRWTAYLSACRRSA